MKPLPAASLGRPLAPKCRAYPGGYADCPFVPSKMVWSTVKSLRGGTSREVPAERNCVMNQSSLQPLPVEQLQHPDARWLMAYWRGKSPDGDLPSYRSVNGYETRAIARHLLVVEADPAAGTLRYASVGAAIRDRFRMDLSGHALPPESGGVGWTALIRQAAEGRRPAAARGHLPGRADPWVRFEILALPFADERGDNSIVVIGLFFFDR